MGRNSRLVYLPDGVLQQLHQRLIDSHFSRYEEHEAWLKELGFTTSKSAIHRYAMANEEAIQSGGEQLPHEADVRLSCLEIASRLSSPGASVEDVLLQAEQLLKWVNQPSQPITPAAT